MGLIDDVNNRKFSGGGSKLKILPKLVVVAGTAGGGYYGYDQFIANNPNQTINVDEVEIVSAFDEEGISITPVLGSNSKLDKNLIAEQLSRVIEVENGNNQELEYSDITIPEAEIDFSTTEPQELTVVIEIDGEEYEVVIDIIIKEPIVSDDENYNPDLPFEEDVNNAPRIQFSSLSDLVVSSGDINYNYLQNIEVIDDNDTNLVSAVSVDDSAVLYNTPGTYDVVYSVTDSGGLTTTATRKAKIVKHHSYDASPGIDVSVYYIHTTELENGNVESIYRANGEYNILTTNSNGQQIDFFTLSIDAITNADYTYDPDLMGTSSWANCDYEDIIKLPNGNHLIAYSNSDNYTMGFIELDRNNDLVELHGLNDLFGEFDSTTYMPDMELVINDEGHITFAARYEYWEPYPAMDYVMVSTFNSDIEQIGSTVKYDNDRIHDFDLFLTDTGKAAFSYKDASMSAWNLDIFENGNKILTISDVALGSEYVKDVTELNNEFYIARYNSANGGKGFIEKFNNSGVSLKEVEVYSEQIHKVSIQDLRVLNNKLYVAGSVNDVTIGSPNDETFRLIYDGELNIEKDTSLLVGSTGGISNVQIIVYDNQYIYSISNQYTTETGYDYTFDYLNDEHELTSVYFGTIR